MHKTTDIDKMGETMSRTTQKSAHTAMDYAFKTQEMNTKLLQQTSQAWIEGFRYQAKLSQGMAQVFFGQWGNALAGMSRVALPVQRQSRSEVTEPATNGAQKAEPAAKATEIAAKDAQKKAETRKAEKVAEQTRKATETAATSAQKSTEPAAEQTQKNTETATPIDGYDEMNVGEVSERLDGLSATELNKVREYEEHNKNRETLVEKIDRKVVATA